MSLMPPYAGYTNNTSRPRMPRVVDRNPLEGQAPPFQTGSGNDPENQANSQQAPRDPATPRYALTPTNNAFQYGWDFGAHRTPESFGSAREPKYWLSNYLISNNIDPNSDWADGAANWLRDQGVQGVMANGGRRVSFGDEFVDSTKQAGQFFWGSNPGSRGGYDGGRGPGGAASAYGPMVTPNGLPPPGMPWNPAAQGEFESMQNTLMQNLLKNPVISPEMISRMNEQQKEIALGRQQQAQRGYAANAASRGVLGGGAAAAQQRRAADETSRQLLESQRDIENNAALTNREGFLNGLSATESILQNRFGRGLSWQQFLEGIRQFGVNDTYRNNAANLNAQQAFMQLLMGS